MTNRQQEKEMVKSNLKEEQQMRQEQHFNNVIEAGLSPLETDDLDNHLDIITRAVPNWITTRKPLSVKDLLLKMWPVSLWEKLTEKVNDYL